MQKSINKDFIFKVGMFFQGVLWTCVLENVDIGTLLQTILPNGKLEGYLQYVYSICWDCRTRGMGIGVCRTNLTWWSVRGYLASISGGWTVYGLNRNKEILGQFIISGGLTVYGLNRNKGTRVQFIVSGGWTVYGLNRNKGTLVQFIVSGGWTVYGLNRNRSMCSVYHFRWLDCVRSIQEPKHVFSLLFPLAGLCMSCSRFLGLCSSVRLIRMQSSQWIRQ